MNLLTLFRQAALMLVIDSVAGMTETPIICVSSPVLTVEAGTSVQATINGQPGTRCEATLRFTDPEFLPVHYSFKSITCLGDLEEATLRIPLEVPNGDAYLLWTCIGQNSPTCNHLIITGGDNDPASIMFDQSGTVGCRVPIATITTLSTVTGATTTLVETMVSKVFEDFVPIATTTNFITMTDATTTVTQSVVSTYFSTLPLSSTSVLTISSNLASPPTSTSITSATNSPSTYSSLSTSASTTPPSVTSRSVSSSTTLSSAEAAICVTTFNPTSKQ